MKKMFDKKIIYGVIIGIIITSSIGALAANYLYNSEQVSYNGAQPNVEKALNELYDNNKNKSGVPSEIAKDANGNNAFVNYYGPRVSSVTKSFVMNKGKYLLNIYSTFTQSYYGGDSSSAATVSGGNITKINNYCYIVEVVSDRTTINISFNSGGYGNSEDSRTMYAITFLK